MADIEVQAGTATISSDGQTVTLSTAVGSLNSAFVLLANNRHVGAGSSTGNAEGDDMGVRAALTATDTITFNRPSPNPGINTTVYWMVIEYVGPASGPHEFVVRDRSVLTYTSATSDTVDLSSSGIVNVDDCIPFITGAMTGDTADGANGMAITAYLKFVGNPDRRMRRKRQRGQELPRDNGRVHGIIVVCRPRTLDRADSRHRDDQPGRWSRWRFRILVRRVRLVRGVHSVMGPQGRRDESSHRRQLADLPAGVAHDRSRLGVQLQSRRHRRRPHGPCAR